MQTSHMYCRAMAALVLALALASGTAAEAQVTILVPDDYPTIQEAINAADDGDEVVVAPGNYHETIDFLGKAIHLRSSDGADVTTIHALGIPASVVTFTSGEAGDSILDGFSITFGSGTQIGSQTFGGAVAITAGSPTITNCLLFNNEATSGGAIDIELGSPLIENCTFNFNSATLGGAIAVHNAAPTIIGCTFEGNTATLGGAVRFGASSAGTVSGGQFVLNSASSRGGAIAIEDASPNVLFSTFTNNSAWEGGGVSVVAGMPMISECAFAGNFGSHAGGAIYNEVAQPFISDCEFEGNASEPEMIGGTVTNGGGGAIHNAWLSQPFIQRCDFTNNACTQDGGALANLTWSAPTIFDSTFAKNAADRFGGAIVNYDHGDALIVNTDFHANVAPQGAAIFSRQSSNVTLIGCTVTNHDTLVVRSDIESNIQVDATTFEYNVGTAILSMSGAPTIVNSIFAHNGPGTVGVVFHSSIDTQPLQLGQTLFCSNLAADVLGSWDDLGGNEFLDSCPWSILGDLNFDGAVDVQDLLLLLAAWGDCPDESLCLADLDGDGIVNVQDLLILLASWG